MSLSSKTGKIAGFVVAIVLLIAGFSKLVSPFEFANTLRNYRIFPERFSTLFALYLPWLEIVVAISIFSGKLRKAGLLLSILLFIAFIIAMLSVALRGIDTNCGCFGKFNEKIGLLHVLEDFVLLSLALWAFIKEVKQ